MPERRVVPEKGQAFERVTQRIAATAGFAAVGAGSGVRMTLIAETSGRPLMAP